MISWSLNTFCDLECDLIVEHLLAQLKTERAFFVIGVIPIFEMYRNLVEEIFIEFGRISIVSSIRYCFVAGKC